ncbi:Uncharacterised protein [Burkholderia pseudomallei]|nr:hypothetical protein BOC51_21310 [Burkholderia pseudomallei]CAJ4432362.1 Uncharacterised protein [Burkholderia pseudomallei]CAJ4726735.1 Uncharacterised protein [Burkholderia pseudomallei]CAJ6174660.1 Uncharacterised protein [Burkholderia pseudomallei]CAJ7341293.1 Uncharacterised protein [Burkholderia pseudomallei]
MIDQDKMRALVSETRHMADIAIELGWNGCAEHFTECADAIDLLLAEVEAKQQMLTESFERQEAGFDRCFEALRDAVETERSWSSLVLEINHLRAELEAAAADKLDAERWREIYNGHYIICKVYSNGDVQNLGGGYIGKYAIDAALSQRQEES